MKITNTCLILFLASMAAVAFFAIACGGGGDESGDDDDGFNPGDDDSGDDDGGGYDDYRNAIPDPDSIALRLPGDEGKKAVGELATLYDATVDFTRDVNDHVLYFLSCIDEITSYPPSDEQGDTLIWGPWKEDGLSPVDMMFEMTLVGTDTYDYYLNWRPKDTDEDWTVVWEGHTVASTSTARRGEGWFKVYYTTAQALDPTIDAQGEIDVTYDTVSDGRKINLEYIDFYSESEDMAGPLDAMYQYHNHADNTGQFLFDYYYDVHYNEHHGEQYALYEHAWFNTRWFSDGDGRTDVVIVDGDLPEMSIAEYHISECWGSDFLRDYYIETAIMEFGPDQLVTEEGDPQECAFEPEMPATL